MADFDCKTFFKKNLVKKTIIVVIIAAIIWLPAFLSPRGSTYHMKLRAIAVSADEQYIGCFETGDGFKIRCFRNDSSTSFVFDVPTEVSAGGHCTLWFEGDNLCALFYRTKIILYLSPDGTIINKKDGSTMKYPPEYPNFLHNGNQYVFEGKLITVTYDEGSYFDYLYFDGKRKLVITNQNKVPKEAWLADASDGVLPKK